MIHRTAIIETGAELGRDVAVGPFSCISAGVRIGDECVIGPHVTIFPGTTLGCRCRVHAGAVLADTPQDLSFEGVDSWVRLGNDCTIREGVTIHRGTKEGTGTVVGDGCYLMAFSHLAHNVTLGERVVLANGVLLGGYVQVGDRVFVSGNAGIHQFARVGRLAMVSGGCGVSKDIPPFCLMRPIALNRVAGLNVVGMRRAGMSAQEREEARQAFKVVYRSGLNVKQAVARLRAEFDAGPAMEFVDFIEHSERGICGAEPSSPREEG